LLLLLGAMAITVVAQEEKEEAATKEAAKGEENEEEEEEEEEDMGISAAQLLVRRTFLNDSFAEGVAMHVRLEIFNVGTKFVVVTAAAPLKQTSPRPVLPHD